MTQPGAAGNLQHLIVEAVNEYDEAARAYFVSAFFDELTERFCPWCDAMHPECDNRPMHY